MALNFAPFLLSFKLASITTIILFVVCVPFAWYLSQTKSKLKPFLESISALPIVLPPSVLGFYLLVFLAPNSIIGKFLYTNFNLQLLFTFKGLIIASCFYSLPFMLQPLQSGFEHLNKNMIEASFLAKKTQFETILKIALPNIKPSLLTAIVVTFAHTIGEFGVVLMVGGSIPNETKVASVAIYEMVEVMDYSSAYIYSGLMVAISFLILLILYKFTKQVQ